MKEIWFALHQQCLAVLAVQEAGYSFRWRGVVSLAHCAYTHYVRLSVKTVSPAKWLNQPRCICDVDSWSPRKRVDGGLNSPAGSRVGSGLVQCSRHRNASIGGVKPLLRKAAVTVETRQVACITGAVLVKNQKSPIR